ncbi:MAG: hypothetical protein CVV64_04365 [Candidatus Wallbacteria bacterium HGW-Wallbacteria-1]|jgi:two-component system response regulator HydG|uniref:Sigma-54 factor interaction domain-containing protein n=1 Tax=Candidatus Wallbacteria bacterium HGW-Wallbacteria-1 TaxID=2013854 RepID=A0A2N1PRP3_9BACT|nr:MAG: hypothetical protein CVV64_04365 [Candidatus Wallbacteria bacterium HGW-Wallbacteria-1]
MKIVVVDPLWSEREFSQELNRWALTSSVKLLVTGDGGKAIQTVREGDVDLVLLNVEGENYDGRKLFKKLKNHQNYLPVVILIPGKDSSPSYFKLGADGTFFISNLDVDLLISTIASLALSEMDDPFLAGRSDALRTLRNHIYSVSKFGGELPVLVRGGFGSGREHVAREIHRLSQRGKGPFVRFICGGYTSDFLERQLFGRFEKSRESADKDEFIPGAIARASGGILYMEDADTLSPELQMRLATTLKTGEYFPQGGNEANRMRPDCQLILSTGPATAEPGVTRHGRRMEEELFAVISSFPLDVPDLKDRHDDIPLISSLFLARHNNMNLNIQGFSDQVMVRLTRYSFPGNLVELENLVRRALIISRGDHSDSRFLGEEHFAPLI